MAEDLLNEWLHGKTQNVNEALNGLIYVQGVPITQLWSRLPITVFIGSETIEMGVNSAIIHFNDERDGVLKVLEHFGLKGEKLWR